MLTKLNPDQDNRTFDVFENNSEGKITITNSNNKFKITMLLYSVLTKKPKKIHIHFI